MATSELMSCRNCDNDTGTFRNSDIPSFEIQTEDIDNPLTGPYCMKAKFSILYDVIFLVERQGKFEIDHSWK